MNREFFNPVAEATRAKSTFAPAKDRSWLSRPVSDQGTSQTARSWYSDFAGGLAQATQAVDQIVREPIESGGRTQRELLIDFNFYARVLGGGTIQNHRNGGGLRAQHRDGGGVD